MLRLALLLSLLPRAEAPLVGRPSEHFYGAVGERVRVELRASRTQMAAEEPFILTMFVHDVDDPARVRQPELAKLPEFASRFHIENLPPDGPPRSPRVFRYRLRPKDEQVRDVPPVLFHYYNPRLNYFATTASRETIELQVTPRTPPSQAMPLDEPEILFDMSNDERLGDSPMSERIKLGLFVAALVVPALIFAIALSIWRMRNPSAARLAALRQSQAVRRALDALAGADSPERVVRIVLQFLRARHGLPDSAATPPEVAAQLTGLGFAPELVERMERFIHASDAARFGPGSHAAAELSPEAQALILALEAHI